MAKALTRWPPIELVQIETTLNRLKADITSGSDPDALAWLAQLLVIKSAGYIEQSALLSARAHISTLATGTTRRYGLARVENYFGPSPGQLSAFVLRFDPEWAKEFTALLDDDDEQVRRSLTALLAARDQIAHGRSHSVGVVKALEYCNAAEIVAAWFQLRLNPL